jgi:hypothetical protein
VKSSTSTGIRASNPASAPRRGCGVTANIQAPIERTAIPAIAGILIVVLAVVMSGCLAGVKVTSFLR